MTDWVRPALLIATMPIEIASVWIQTESVTVPHRTTWAAKRLDQSMIEPLICANRV